MFFMCKDVNVYNYEYHYHNSQGAKTITKKVPSRISTLTCKPNNNNNKLNQNQQQSCNGEPTLLQKVRRKIESLQTTLYATNLPAKQIQCRPSIEKERKMVKSNLNVKRRSLANQSVCLHGAKSAIFHQHPSFILPKEILISHTFNEQATDSLADHFILEEQSSLVMPTIGDKFIYLKNMVSKADYNEHLALDTQLGAIVSIRSIPLQEDAAAKAFKQSQIYSKLGRHLNILDLYHICFNGNQLIFLKQPYTKVTPQLADKQAVAQDIACALEYLQLNNIHAGCIKLQDIRCCVGTWKISNLDNLFQSPQIPLQNNISQLISQIN